MENAIKNFASQFEFQPVIENESKLKPADSFVLCGMGGSHLAAGILKMRTPSLDMYVHRSYGLPAFSEKRFKESLYIASSYSGNTEEVLDFAEKAFASGYQLAVLATGGKLIDFAKQHTLPYIQMPDTGIQPRSALGYSTLALAKMIGDDEVVSELQKLHATFDPLKFQKEGQELARVLQGKVPIIYASRMNMSIAYNWKIKCNETAKIPAFYNVFPELNHNEMNGFDVVEKTKDLSSNFHFIFLEDSNDQPKIMHRMEIVSKLYADRNLPVKIIQLSGTTIFEKIFNSLSLADWTALSLSTLYGTEPEQVPMVEEFKKLIA